MKHRSSRGALAVFSMVIALLMLGPTATAARAAPDERLSLSLDGRNWTTSSSIPLWSQASIVPGDHQSSTVWIRNDSTDEAVLDVGISTMTLATNPTRPFYQDVRFNLDWTDGENQPASANTSIADVQPGTKLQAVLPAGKTTSVIANVTYPVESTEGGDSARDAFTVALRVKLAQSPPGTTPSEPGGNGAPDAPNPGADPSQPGGNGAPNEPNPGADPSQPGGNGAPNDSGPAAAPLQPGQDNGSLASTGADVALIILLGLAMIAGGVALAREHRSRRRLDG